VTILVEAVQQECYRCRKVQANYVAIGPIGKIGHILIELKIVEGEASIASGDVVRMVEAYRSLQGFRG
jgi:hypothetical protein